MRRGIGVGTIRDIGIKHDIKHVVSVPLKSNGNPLAGHVDLMPGPGRLQSRDGDEAARAENWRSRPGVHELMEARDERRLRALQKHLNTVKLLIVDELGYVPFTAVGSELRTALRGVQSAL